MLAVCRCWRRAGRTRISLSGSGRNSRAVLTCLHGAVGRRTGCRRHVLAVKDEGRSCWLFLGRPAAACVRRQVGQRGPDAHAHLHAAGFSQGRAAAAGRPAGAARCCGRTARPRTYTLCAMPPWATKACATAGSGTAAAPSRPRGDARSAMRCA